MDPVVIENLLQRLVTGVLVGSIYGLLCTGLGMIFGVIRVINFAQGEFMMLGMYATMIVGAALAATFALGPAAGAYLAIGVAAILLAGSGWALVFPGRSAGRNVRFPWANRRAPDSP